MRCSQGSLLSARSNPAVVWYLTHQPRRHGVKVVQELLITTEVLDPSSRQIRFGLPELLLPVWTVDPSIFLGDDASKPATVSGEHCGDMAISGHIYQLREMFSCLGRCHLLNLVWQWYRVLAPNCMASSPSQS